MIAIRDRIDLVIPLSSRGFHYPVGTCVQAVCQLLSEQGRLLSDVRKDGRSVHAERLVLYG